MENRKIKILAIDDSTNNLISLKALLRETFKAAKIFTTLSGEKGIAMAAEIDPDVILLDIIMPGLDGFEVCRRLKSDGKLCEIPIVFITALNSDKQSRIRALECGAESFLYKPIDQSELIAQIRAMVKIKDAVLLRRTENTRLEELVAQRTAELNEAHLKELSLFDELRKENEGRKKSEEALKRSEERYKSFISRLSEGIFRLESDQPMNIHLSADEQVDYIHNHFYLAECNEAFVSMYGYNNSAEVIGKFYLEFQHGRNNQTNVEAVKRFIHQGYKDDIGITEFEDSTGKKVIISNNSLGIVEDEHLVRIWGTQANITETIKAREIQDVLLEISKFALTNDHYFRLLDKVKEQLSRLLDSENFYIALYDESNGLLTTHSMKDKMDNIECWPAEKSATGYVIKHKRTLLADEAKMASLCRKGQIDIIGTPAKIWLGVPLIANGRAFGAIVVQNYDNPLAFTVKEQHLLEFISGQVSVAIERKKAEHDLQEALIRAQESDRLKSAFLANMSHEIRTPMNGIIGFTELLKDTALSNEEQQMYVNIIQKSGERMLNVINEIIDISKIEAGQVDLHIEKVNINEKIEYVYNLLKREAEAKNVGLSFYNSLSTSDSIIYTDETKFYSVILNLVKNAIKYTNQGNIEFGYYLKPAEFPLVGRKTELTFFVRDTGIGIPGDRQEAIFERFIQADIADVAARQGAGLGLSIARAYVELLGGKIWVDSELGLGSTFFFTHPYHFESQGVVPEAKGEVAASNSLIIKKLNILMVEDDMTSALYVKAMLRGIGHMIKHVVSGIEAVNIVRTDSSIDLILMDIRLPELNGYEATKQIRQINPDVLIIALTAFALSGDREKSLEAGCNGYLAKPVRKEDLLALISKLLGELN